MRILADLVAGIADGLGPLPHRQARQIADGLADGHGRQEPVLVRIGELKREYAAAAPEIRAAGGVVRRLGRGDFSEFGAKQNQPPALLRDAIMRGKQNLHGDVIIEPRKFS